MKSVDVKVDFRESSILRSWVRQGAMGLFLILTLFATTSCEGHKTESSSFSEILYKPKYAIGFDIQGTKSSQNTLINVHNPWQGAEDVTTQLLIARDDDPIPDNYHGQILKGDAKRIVTLSSTHISMLEALGETSKVVGVSLIDYIANEYIRYHKDQIKDIGYEGHIDYESLLSLQPDIVLLYGMNGTSGMESKLEELGLPYVYLGDYLEESPLGRAEWVVVVAEILGIRDKGIALFQEIPERYNALKEKVEVAKAKSPTVMVNTPYGDTWFMPSTNSFIARLIKDAGGDYVYRKNTGNKSMPIDLEEAYLMANQADIWIHTGGAHSLRELKESYPKFSTVPSIVKEQVYNNNSRELNNGGNDFFESATMAPDIVLADLIEAFHPELLDHELYYYKRLQ